MGLFEEHVLAGDERQPYVFDGSVRSILPRLLLQQFSGDASLMVSEVDADTIEAPADLETELVTVRQLLGSA